MFVDVLILAGASNQGPLDEQFSERYEAFIEIDNKPMIKYVVRGVNQSSYTDKIAVIGPEEKLRNILYDSVDIIIENEKTMTDNIKKGFKVLERENKEDTDKFILLVTSDIPLISGDIIDRYISLCNDGDADIYFPVISKKITEEKFPEVNRTYVNLADGVYTGGNISLIRPKVLPEILKYIKKATSLRKNPLRLSQMLGFKFLVKFFTGRLTFEEIEKRVTQIMGCKGRVIVTEMPEIGFDIDKPDDLYLMKQKYIKQHIG